MNQGSKTIITILVTAILVGGGVYLWQQNEPSAEKNAGKNAMELEKKPADTATERIKFPVIAYSREGYLNNTESGKMAKKQLEEKLINPYRDYYNEEDIALVALYIEVPVDVGAAYRVTGIFCGREGACGGTEQFSFGKREGEYDYWTPACFGECQFSEAFKKKYPQITGSSSDSAGVEKRG